MPDTDANQEMAQHIRLLATWMLEHANELPVDVQRAIGALAFKVANDAVTEAMRLVNSIPPVPRPSKAAPGRAGGVLGDR